MKKLILLTAFLLFSYSSLSQAANTQYFAIEKLEVNRVSKRIYVYPVGDVDQKATCSNMNMTRYVFNINAFGADQMYSLLLTAAAAGKQVKARVGSTCIDSHQNIQGIEAVFSTPRTRIPVP